MKCTTIIFALLTIIAGTTLWAQAQPQKAANPGAIINVEVLSATKTVTPQPIRVARSMPGPSPGISWDVTYESKNLPKMNAMKREGRIEFGALPSDSIFIIVRLRFVGQANERIEDSDLALEDHSGTQYLGAFWSRRLEAWVVSTIGLGKEGEEKVNMLFVVKNSSLGQLSLRFRKMSIGPVTPTD